jgi:beta-aspartyl-peptidase (threonine type)
MVKYISMRNKYCLAIHGGAGTISKSLMNATQEVAYKEGLMNALSAGEEVLKKGGTALDAVTAAVKSLEDFPLFNAGRGAVFTNRGEHELDASIMNGINRSAGAIAGVKGIANPILLARAVMDRTEHVLLAGEGAILFAKTLNMELVNEQYFFTEQRYQQWQNALKDDKVVLDHSGNNKMGTVGAVALDEHGNLAAATSTGGMTNKKFGRIGDTPIPGAGVWADNSSCAVSCTGHGEYFMKWVVAYDVACLMDYKGLSLKEAVKLVVREKLVKAGGEGGLIALDAAGNMELVFNSEGMYRAWVREGEEMQSAIY